MQNLQKKKKEWFFRGKKNATLMLKSIKVKEIDKYMRI